MHEDKIKAVFDTMDHLQIHCKELLAVSIKRSGVCFDLYADREVGTAVCHLPPGHKGKHQSGYLEWSGTHSFVDSIRLNYGDS